MCLFALLGLVVPRVALFLLWFFAHARVAVFDPWWLGLLGFLFLPYSALTFVLIHWSTGEVDGVVALVLMILALGLDLGVWGGSRKKRVVVETRRN